MTHDEAFKEIGVPPGSSLEEIRRAYLRKTRTWNPAADPDGLRRLREAHDLLQTAPFPQPPPLSRPGTYSAAPALRSAAPFYEPSEPVGSWTSSVSEADPVPESSGWRWLFILGGGLVLFLALWLWLVRFQKENEPSAVPQTLAPYIEPPVGGYDSAQQGLAELCLTRGPKNKEFCELAEGILRASEQHRCSEAKALRKRFDIYFVPRGGAPGQGATEKLASFKEKIDEEIARCWKFWNP